MAAQSIEFTRRQVSRVMVTANAALAAPAGEQVALKALAEDIIAQGRAFDAADKAVQAAERVAAKEVSESSAAMSKLRQMFDQMREVSAAKLNVTYEAASAFPTDDDLLNAAEDLEEGLQAGDPEWATSVLEAFTPVLETASKEAAEGVSARKAVQQATLARDQAEGNLRPVLVRFRRAVRATFGSSARQYREILDRRTRKGQSDDPADGGAPLAA